MSPNEISNTSFFCFMVSDNVIVGKCVNETSIAITFIGLIRSTNMTC